MKRSPYNIFARPKKKAQAQQVFIFMLAIFLAAIILIFGYRMISKFMGDIKQTAAIEFQTKIEGGIKKMAPKFNSVEMLELNVPGDFEKVCLFEPGFTQRQLTNICGGTKGDTDGDFPADRDYDLALCNLWPDQYGQDNVFLVPLSDQLSIKTTPITIANGNGYLCLKPTQGRIALRLEGKGDHTVVSKWHYT